MTLDTFAETGFLARIQPGAKIERFHVLGERSSGTNFTKRLLGRNTDLEPTEALGWKHGFPTALAIGKRMLVVGVVRRADTWARSMHTRPWHSKAHLQRLPFSEFIRAEWDSAVDHRSYFGGPSVRHLEGQDLQWDRHPITGLPFLNIFQMRSVKLQGLLSYLNRDCSFLLMRMEDVIANPEHTLNHIHTALDRPAPEGAYKPVVKRLGTRFVPTVAERPFTPDTLSDADAAFMRSQLEPAQEALLGYSYD